MINSGGVCRKLYSGSCGPYFCKELCTHNLGYDPLPDDDNYVFDIPEINSIWKRGRVWLMATVLKTVGR